MNSFLRKNWRFASIKQRFYFAQHECQTTLTGDRVLKSGCSLSAFRGQAYQRAQLSGRFASVDF
jgi:hypothetical protein